jgi:hypothetical protein
MRLQTIILFLFSVQFSLAQGEYVERGKSAYGVALSAGTSTPVSAITGSAAISALGTFDIGISYSFLSVDKSGSGEPFSRAISPFASLHVVKQGQAFPASLSAHVVLQIYSSPSQYSKSFSTWSYSGSIFTAAPITENVTLQPMLTVSATKRVLTQDWEDNPSIMGYELSVSIVWPTQSSTKLFFQPSVGLSKVEPAFAFAIGIVGVLAK